jgi:hypothetical protein
MRCIDCDYPDPMTPDIAKMINTLCWKKRRPAPVGRRAAAQADAI